MTLSAASLEWAIRFVSDHSEGDIFPKTLENKAIEECSAEFIALVEGKPLNQFEPGAPRRFIVPKDEISYRQATQLDPQDSILLSAVVHQFGQGIEDRRLPVNNVFSYRFSPTTEHGLYGSQTAWNTFWKAVHVASRSSKAILYCDIADFYNQIYHHAVENQLFESGFPNQAVNWVLALLESTTAGVSRGVPIGPHAAHLIAEATLIPIDNTMAATGLRFLRYADDILVFCDSEAAAKRSLAQIATILDKQQRLTLQKHKTRFLRPDECRTLSARMIEDRPISADEDRLLKLIRKYSGGNPYRTISYNQVSAKDWAKISEEVIRKIIHEYIDRDEVDYIRLRWLYRRLAQIGHPGAIDASLALIDKLEPCFANICTYLASVQSIDEIRWKQIGLQLLQLLETDAVKSNEFFRLSILSLFSRNPHINHFTKLVEKFQESDSYAKREIFLAAKENGAFDWLRQYKEDFNGMDAWQKRAFVFCCAGFPRDERKYFLNRCTFDRPFDVILARWAKK
jgi:retron-type reverse transcriptase